MIDHMEPLVLDANYDAVENNHTETPLDETTEWIEVINRRRDEERKKAEERRQEAAKYRAEFFKQKEAEAEEEARQYAQMMAVMAQRRHRNKIILCLSGIVLMLLLSGGSFALQYAGYLKFPWSIVITGAFCAVAAFFAGIVWESCREQK